MASLVDLVIATGLFFVFIVVVLNFVLTYYSNFQSILQDSELRTQTANVYNIFFGGKGVPSNWETLNTTPVRIGLLNDLYREPVIITTTNSTPLNNATLNFTMMFDPACMNTTRENTIRVYNESNQEHTFTLYNKTFCVANTFLKSADFAMNVTLPALTGKIFYVYFSPETGVNATGLNVSGGTIPFPINVTNYTVIKYPIDAMTQVSPSKIRALRNLTYSQVAQTLGSNTRFDVEVDAP